MGDNPEDCPVCLTPYDDVLRRPRTMPCGHSLCSHCIEGIRVQGYVTCPTCRVQHVMPEGMQFPVSYTLEAFVERLKLTEAIETASAASLPPKSCKRECAATRGNQWEAAGLSRSIRFLLQDQEAKVLAAISTCQEVQAQLGEYRTTLTSLCEQQQRLETGLQRVIDESRNARMLVRQEESMVMAKKEETKDRERQLHAALETLRRVSSAQEALPAVDDADHRTEEAQLRGEECREMFPDKATAVAAGKALEAPHAALEAAHRVREAQEAATNADREPRPPPNSSWTITDKLKDMLAPPTLTAEHLRSLTQPARRLLLADRVFAVHQVDGLQRFSRITMTDDRVFLHTLQDLSPPLGAATLQASKIVPPSPPCLVFLDLCWPSSVQRRVLIRLSPDTPMGRQFVLLCTGMRGPSYANTWLWGVGDKGLPGERLWFGDYEMNNGKGGPALLPDLAKGHYGKSGRAGVLWGTWQWGGRARGAQFGITTRDRKDRGVWNDVFGEVVEGMNHLAAAIQYNNITEVTVVDCGVVLKG